MGRRRSRRTRSDHGGRRLDVTRAAGGPPPSPWTIEGYIDFIGRAARRGKRSGMPPWLFLLLVTLCLAAIALGLYEVITR